MNNIDRLIATLYPNGVEYSPLEKLCISLKKSTLTQDKLNDSLQYPVINSGRDYYGRFSEYNNEGNAIVIASRGEYAGFVSYISEKFWAGGLCYPYRSRSETKAHTKYIFYVLKNSEQRIMDSLVARGSIPALNKADIDKFLIPLPPLPVQEEIVRILDTFSGMVAELEAEQAARVRQYEHYHDSMFVDLIFDGVEEKSLGEICTDMYRGSGIKRDQVTLEGTPCVRYGEIYTTYSTWFDKCVSHTNADEIQNKKYFEHGDILFAITGENVEEIAKSTVYLGHDRCLAGGDIVVMKHLQNPKYVAYALSTNNAQDQKSKGKVKSKVVHSSVPSLKNIKIPIPSLEVQEEIVSILDRFDALVNDLKSGLPAEIALRRKQYEHYRDTLLTFTQTN